MPNSVLATMIVSFIVSLFFMIGSLFSLFYQRRRISF
jgi:hypothetical protein